MAMRIGINRRDSTEETRPLTLEIIITTVAILTENSNLSNSFYLPARGSRQARSLFFSTFNRALVSFESQTSRLVPVELRRTL